MVGLSLEGGGAKGSYQAGAYLALRRCHIKIDVVVGTSIGSLNAALIAQGDYRKMIKLWKDASMSELLGIDEELAYNILNNPINMKTIKNTFKEIIHVLKEDGLDIGPYRALIRNCVDEERVRSSSIKYGLTTLKLNNLKPIELFIDDIPTNKLNDYILASSYLPIFKKQKLIDNSYYLDGGVYNLNPINMLIKAGCDTIYDINIKGIGIRQLIDKKKNVKIIEVKPNDNLGSIILFNEDSIINNMQRGYFDTLKALNHMDGENYYFYKRPEGFYKVLNKKGNKTVFDQIKKHFKLKSDKDCLIKMFEYIMIRESFPLLEVYNPKQLLKKLKQYKKDDSIYEYINSL